MCDLYIRNWKYIRLDQCIINTFLSSNLCIYFDFQIVITSDINVFQDLTLLIKILLFVGIYTIISNQNVIPLTIIYLNLGVYNTGAEKSRI